MKSELHEYSTQLAQMVEKYQMPPYLNVVSTGAFTINGSAQNVVAAEQLTLKDATQQSIGNRESPKLRCEYWDQVRRLIQQT